MDFDWIGLYLRILSGIGFVLFLDMLFMFRRFLDGFEKDLKLIIIIHLKFI